MKKKLHFLSALLVAMLLIPWQLNAQVLSENFDNLTSGVPAGWVVEGNAGSSYNWQVTGYSYPGYNDTKGLWFNSYYADNGATAILKSPVFSLKDVTKVQMLKVACKMTDTGSKASCKICISTDGGSSYETVLQNISYSADWQEVEISLADYAGKDNLCIVFNNVGGWYGRHIIDNFEIAPAPSCAKAKDLTITGIYQYTATFNWSLVSGQGAPASTYEVKVYEAANDSCVATVSASVSPSTDGVYSYTLEEDYELNPGTAHYFTVQGICGLDEKAAVVKSSTFFTLCDPYEITDSRLNLDLSEWTTNPFFPCWATNGIFTSSSYDPSYNSLALDWYSSDEYLYLISPAISHAANDIEVEFEYSSYYASGVTYGVATSADISNFEVLGHIDMKDESGIAIFNTATSQNTQREQFIVLKFDNDEPNIHAITIRKKPCCPKPLSVAVAPIDSASINVSWSGVATKFTVNVYEKGNNVVYKTAEVEGNTATISGLTASTDYAVTIVAACNSCGEGEGSVGYSEMTDSVFVTTLCGVAQNVYLDENFSNSVIPECWMQNKEEVWSINQSGNRIFAFMRGAYIEEGETALLVTQPIAIAADKKGAYDISFEMERRNLSGTTGVGELTVWVNSKASTEGATKIATIERSHKDSPVECAEGWYNYSFNIPASIEGTVYVIFEGESHGSNSNPISITNVKIVDKPTCREVSEIKIGNTATTSLPISWVAEAGQEKWALSYVVKKAGETIVTFDGEVTSVNYTVTGLPSSSELTIEGNVAAVCGEGLRSTAKTFSYSFQTACAPVVLPLEESFENLNKFPPVCWSSENTEGSTSYVWSVNSGSSEKTSDGQGFAYLPSNTTVSKAILSTPELVFEDDKDYRVEFYIYRYAYTSDSYAGAG
ncbi:MAG: fibronectin type III domain-containing protein, partial [Paludibacteraceae bacterium]|nr:fibronectin type III domain-containing protein [Paludibacteraceae bacterium]